MIRHQIRQCQSQEVRSNQKVGKEEKTWHEKTLRAEAGDLPQREESLQSKQKRLRSRLEGGSNKSDPNHNYAKKKAKVFQQD